jgi:Domain of unknown function (DUF932)
MDLQEIYAIQVPVETNSYKPVSHKRLIETIKEVCYNSNLAISGERYMTKSNGEILTGYFNIASISDSEMSLRVGFQNSYNKKVTLKLAIGTSVLVCDNGCVRGDFGAYKRKHTGNIDTITPQRIRKAFCCLSEDFGTIARHRDQMKNIEVDRKTVNELIGDLYIREGIIKETQLSIIKNEIIKPSYDYKTDNSLWQTYNHITHSLKNVHAANFIDVHGQLHEYMVDKYRLV